VAGDCKKVNMREMNGRIRENMNFNKQFSILLIFSILQLSFASVCNDSLYQELKKRDINSLTQNETAYMLSKDQLCQQEINETAIKKAERDKEIQDSVSREAKGQEISRKVGAGVFIGVLIAMIAGAIVYFVINNQIEQAKKGIQ
jgi:hypothetical protein